MSTTPEGINEAPNLGHGHPEWRDSPPAALENLNSITNDTANAAPAEAAADAPFSPLQSRKHQMYPYLTAEEIDRMRRFGDVQYWRAGELMFEVGVPGPGMFVLLNGRVRVTRRDGLGHVHLVTEADPGQFLAEVGQLSGKPALVDGHAIEDVEAILIAPERLRALLVAEAELGERIMRSLILRRVGLIEKGSGPILVGQSDDGRLVSLQGFLSRNGYPHTVIDACTDPEAIALLERISTSKADFPLVICPDGTVMRAPDENQLASQLGWLPKGCRWRYSIAARPAAKPVRVHGSKTISAFRPAFPARHWPDVRSCRRRSSARTSPFRRRSRRFTATACRSRSS